MSASDNRSTAGNMRKHQDTPGGNSQSIQGEPTKATGPTTGKPLFDSEGAIGKQFTSQGSIGGTAQAVGGPLDKEGLVGKQFTDQGSIGGSVQQMLGKGDKASKQ